MRLIAHFLSFTENKVQLCRQGRSKCSLPWTQNVHPMELSPSIVDHRTHVRNTLTLVLLHPSIFFW